MQENNESKLLFIIFFFYILFNLMTIICSSYIYDFELMNMVAFHLYNENILFFTNKGFYTVDQNLSIIYNYTYSFNFDYTLKSNYPFFTQFSKDEDRIVLCLIFNTLFVFNENGQFSYYTVVNEIPENKNCDNNCIINAFKKDGNNYFYIIICNNQDSINFFYYKINENGNNSLIYNNSYTNASENFLQTGCITCQTTINDDKNYLTCFYQYQSQEQNYKLNNNIGEITFAPDDNFSYFEPKKSFLNNDYNEGFYFAFSLTSEDKSKIYVCYRTDNNNVRIFSFNTKTREFSKIYKFDNACERNYYYFNINYFKMRNELFFSCSSSKTLSFIKFNEDMNSFEANTTILDSVFYAIDSFLILYPINSQNYILCLNGKLHQGGNSYTIHRYEISNFEIISTESELNNISDLITNSLMQSTEISKTDKSNYSTEIIEITSKMTTDEINDSSEITELTQNSESNKLIISSEIYQESNEITSSTKVITNEARFESIPTQIMTSIESTNIKLTNELTEFHKIETESIKSSQIFEEPTEIKQIIVKTNDVNYCKDSGMKINEEGKCACNNDEGYYPIVYNNKFYEDKCYNSDTKPQNFYLNKEKNRFEMCHKYCRTCDFHGNETQNNCTSCIDNYEFIPDINNTTNCVLKCKYYYYFNIYDLYSCTLNYQCPTDFNLLIRKKNKCIDDCSKDDTYRYQYSGECYEKCPEDTNTIGYKCEVKNKNSCTLSIYSLNLTFNELINNNLDIYAKNYAEEFNYTNNQIMNYTNKEYSLVLYKNSFCIKELSLTVPQIDFGDCYQKIKSTYNITGDLLIAILDKYIQNRNPITSYFLYHPITGKRINATEVCKNDNIVIKEKVLTFPGIDPTLVQFFADQDINVFNISDKFYSDICKHYLSPNKRDIPLKLRFQIYFPNISLCDENCLSKGVDIKTMESICYCPFTDFNKNSFLGSVFELGDFGEIYSFLSNSNINILFCIKQIFNFEYFKRCIGGFIVMVLIFFETVCIIVYSLKSKISMKKFILNISTLYIQSEKTKDNPPKKKRKSKKINKKHINKKLNTTNLSSNNNINIVNDSNSPKRIRTKIKGKNSIYLSKFTNQIIIQNINNQNISNQNISNQNISKQNLINEHPNKITINNFDEYLSTDPDDMDFDDVIEKDKRTFCEYFGEKIKNKLIIIKTFFIEDKLKPKSIKIMIFILNITFYLSINGLLYTEQYISNLYNNENESFSQFVSRIIENLIYVCIILKVINEIIDCFFIEEKKIKGIFLRGKKNYKKIKGDILLLIKKIEKYNMIFIIISYCILLFSWAYISCFNDVYIYTRKDWIKTTIIFFIFIQVFLLFLSLIETIIRFISIRCQSEKLFKLSQFIN